MMEKMASAWSTPAGPVYGMAGAWGPARVQGEEAQTATIATSISNAHLADGSDTSLRD